MTDDDNDRTLHELDRLLNDPDVPMQPMLIWRLLDEVAKHEAARSAPNPTTD
jgi:hypothetical protein